MRVVGVHGRFGETRGELLGCERWGGVGRSRGSGWGEVGGVVSILGR